MHIYWGTTNLKDEYAPNKIVIKTSIFVEILLEFLIQHNSTTKLNKKVSFRAVSYD